MTYKHWHIAQGYTRSWRQEEAFNAATTEQQENLLPWIEGLDWVVRRLDFDPRLDQDETTLSVPVGEFRRLRQTVCDILNSMLTIREANDDPR